MDCMPDNRYNSIFSVVLIFWFGYQCVALPIEDNVGGRKHAFHSNKKNSTSLPDPDGYLNLYALPVGQGDGHLIQCPDGVLSIFDLGSSDFEDTGFWTPVEIREFLGSQINLVENILLSHNHRDHYLFLPEVFAEKGGIKNMHISCEPTNMVDMIQIWLNDIDAMDVVRTINDGKACGPNGIHCGYLNLCPNHPEITFKVMSANLKDHCVTGNKNTDSIVLKITHGEISILYTGDFEDETSSWNENGPQKQMVDFYGEELVSTVFQISHHGASYLANKPVWRDAIQPKAVFSSGNPWYSYRHPRCAVFDGFIQYVKSLCKPLVTDISNPYFCSKRFSDDGVTLQAKYACGASSSAVQEREGNEYAIYTSVTDPVSYNLISFKTDGNMWQFDVQTFLRP